MFKLVVNFITEVLIRFYKNIFTDSYRAGKVKENKDVYINIYLYRRSPFKNNSNEKVSSLIISFHISLSKLYK